MWTTATLNETNTLAGFATAFDALGGFTLTEKHNLSGFITCHYDFHWKSAAVNAQVFGRWGLIVVEDDAMAAGVLPEAIQDSDAPWLHNQHFHWDESSLTERFVHGQMKAKRRIGIKETLMFQVQVNASSNSSVDWGIGMRILLQRNR